MLHREMLSGKIDKAVVTTADPHDAGSIVIDVALMEAADILESEQVHVIDVATGVRLEDYAVAGERGSGVIGVTGATARMVQPGDTVIILSYARVADAECHLHEPQVVHVDQGNRIVAVGTHPSEVVTFAPFGRRDIGA